MNPRRVHSYMRERFPAFDAVALDWQNVSDAEGPRLQAIREILERFIPSREVLIEVNRRTGDVLSLDDAVRYIDAHLGEGQMLIADREFTGFVVVAQSGVAAGWAHAG